MVTMARSAVREMVEVPLTLMMRAAMVVTKQLETVDRMDGSCSLSTRSLVGFPVRSWCFHVTVMAMAA